MKVLYNDGHIDECPADEVTHVVRHSAAHIMAQAIKRLYPEADFAYGPATENGFYYDIDLPEGQKISEEDFPAIEAEMKKIVKENLKFTTFELPREEAHRPFGSIADVLDLNADIMSDDDRFELEPRPLTIDDTDTGADIREQIADLRALLDAYRSGELPERTAR